MNRKLNIYLQASIWLAYALLVVLVISRSFSLGDALVKGGVIVLIHAGVFYLNSDLLIPRLIADKKTWLYILYVILIFALLFLFFSWFERLFIPENIPDMIRRRLENQRGVILKPLQHIPFFRQRMFAHLLGLLIVLVISSAYSITRLARRKEREAEQARSEKLQSEMKFLKSQINPHFLFNALNNIYSLTLTGSDKSAEMVLKLSGMLRYILYECNAPKVPIEKEWEYIGNYIDFQRIKSREEINLTLEFVNDDPGFRIVPMMLIPFVENAVKHSKVEDTEHGWIRITLNNGLETLVFQAENSIPASGHAKDGAGGIGLENVKRRLELAYGPAHDLIVSRSPSAFTVVLRLRKTIGAQ